MPTQPYHAVLDQLPRADAFDGKASRTCIVADDAIMQAIWVEPGHPPFPIDQHDCDQTVFVFAGRLQLTLNDDDVYVLEAGHVLYIPAGVPHVAKVVGDETLFGLDVFAPVREEYLPLAQHQLDKDHAEQA